MLVVNLEGIRLRQVSNFFNSITVELIDNRDAGGLRRSGDSESYKKHSE